MTNKHLNDADIQQYVLQNSDGNADTIEHMRHCTGCKIKAANYKLLFDEIRAQEKPVFDFNLSELVLKQLPANQTKASEGYSFFYFIVFLFIFCVLALFYLFGNNIVNLFSAIQPMGVALIITTAVCFLLLQCHEMYKKYKIQMHVLNSY
jgi:hypothetical protein